jgi:hypothetical protein
VPRIENDSFFLLCPCPATGGTKQTAIRFKPPNRTKRRKMLSILVLAEAPIKTDASA